MTEVNEEFERINRILSDKTNLSYQSQFCEENIYKLASLYHSLNPISSSAFVVFVSSQERAAPIWFQKAARKSDGYVVWDYHVFMVVKFNSSSSSSSSPSSSSPSSSSSSSSSSSKTKSLVYDFDTTLSYPAVAKDYCISSFKPDVSLSPTHLQTFRVIDSNNYLNYFSSDRSHMKDSNVDFPAWPLIKGDQATSNMNLFSYIEMNNSKSNSSDDIHINIYDRMGEVLKKEDFIEWV